MCGFFCLSLRKGTNRRFHMPIWLLCIFKTISREFVNFFGCSRFSFLMCLSTCCSCFACVSVVGISFLLEPSCVTKRKDSQSFIKPCYANLSVSSTNLRTSIFCHRCWWNVLRTILRRANSCSLFAKWHIKVSEKESLSPTDTRTKMYTLRKRHIIKKSNDCSYRNAKLS